MAAAFQKEMKVRSAVVATMTRELRCAPSLGGRAIGNSAHEWVIKPADFRWLANLGGEV